ncbi:MAG: hypothetical protein ACYC3V_21135 [Chloroflexota bacterium]
MIRRRRVLASLLAVALALTPGVASADMTPPLWMIASLGLFACGITAIVTIGLETPVVLFYEWKWRLPTGSLLWERAVPGNVASQLLLWTLLIALPTVVFAALNALLGHAPSQPPRLQWLDPRSVRLAFDATHAVHADYFRFAWALIVLTAEAAVVAVEYWFYRRAPKLTPRQALVLAMTANAFSFGVGSIILPWWKVVL